MVQKSDHEKYVPNVSICLFQFCIILFGRTKNGSQQFIASECHTGIGIELQRCIRPENDDCLIKICYTIQKTFLVLKSPILIKAVLLCFGFNRNAEFKITWNFVSLCFKSFSKSFVIKFSSNAHVKIMHFEYFETIFKALLKRWTNSKNLFL